MVKQLVPHQSGTSKVKKPKDHLALTISAVLFLKFKKCEPKRGTVQFYSEKEEEITLNLENK